MAEDITSDDQTEETDGKSQPVEPKVEVIDSILKVRDLPGEEKQPPDPEDLPTEALAQLAEMRERITQLEKMILNCILPPGGAFVTFLRKDREPPPGKVIIAVASASTQAEINEFVREGFIIISISTSARNTRTELWKFGDPPKQEKTYDTRII